MNNLVSAVFDNREEARRSSNWNCVTPASPTKRSQLLGPPDNDDEIHEDGDEASKGSVAGAVAGGGVAGALLGVGALAIPGVGPLVAAGAIASISHTRRGRNRCRRWSYGWKQSLACLATMKSKVADARVLTRNTSVDGGIFVSVDTRLAEGTAESAQIIARALWRAQRF